jgi:hypothetical protein
MREETEHEEECEMMSVPKYFEALLPDLMVGSCIHQEHDEEHEMTGYTARLGIMYFLSSLLANFCSCISKQLSRKPQLIILTGALDVNEVHVVSRGVNRSPKSHRVCHLSVEPDIFVGREEPGNLGSNDTNNVAQHWKEDETAIVRKNQTCTTRSPD